jgi:uncharacterized protein (DUF2267 family)
MTKHFDDYAAEGNHFLKQVAETMGIPGDTEQAFRIVQAVFHTLRDRITFEESLHLISQLPMVLKAVYVNNWKPKDRPEKYETKADFLSQVIEHNRTAAIDLDNTGEREVRAVFSVLRDCISAGELAHVEGQLPKEIAELMEA